MRNILLVILVLLLSSWGKIGHRTVGEIAQRQLTFTAEQKINEILDGQSLAVASTWADEMRSNPEFDKYSTWHYVNLPLDKEYDDVEHLGPNIVKMINTAIPILQSPMADKKTKHVLWDTDMIDDYKMSYTEYATKLQNQFKDTVVEQGNAIKWANESHEYVSKIYETKGGTYLSYDYVYENLPIVDERLYFAGIRLGNLLNNIFGE